MNTNEHIKIEKKKEIGIIILDKPAMNILDTKMLGELEDSLDELENDDKIRAIIITGEKNFCAGADIKERATTGAARPRAFTPSSSRTSPASAAT